MITLSCTKMIGMSPQECDEYADFFRSICVFILDSLLSFSNKRFMELLENT